MLLDQSTDGTTEASDADAVAAAVAHLGPLDREALLLRVGGRSVDEVAARTGTTAAMVRVRLHRAATAIEGRVGIQPVDGEPVPTVPGRSTEDAVIDAEVGITPLLHARLVRALAHDRATPTTPRFRRLAALLQRATDRGPQLATLATVTGVGAVTALALVGAA